MPCGLERPSGWTEGCEKKREATAAIRFFPPYGIKKGKTVKGVFHVEQRNMDYHLHTLHSPDAEQSVDELCQTALARGVQEICLTEHMDLGHPDPINAVPPLMDAYRQDVNDARRRYPQLTIRMGLEIGDIPQTREETRRFLQHEELDFRLLSLHVVHGTDCWNPAYYDGKTRDEAYREYVEVLAEMLDAWEDFDSVAHIGYVAKFAPYEGEKKALRYEDAPATFDHLLKRIIALDKCIEINTSGYKVTGEMFPHPSIVRRYIALGGEGFTFGSDSHDTARDYEEIDHARDEVRAMGGKYQASFCKRKKSCFEI